MSINDGFKRARSMAAAIALALSEFAKNTTELIPAIQKIQQSKLYQSRGKGGKGRARGKLMCFRRNSVNAQPHQGEQEIARRLRGCHPASVPQRKWYVDPFHDTPYQTRAASMNSPLYRNTPAWARTPAHLV